MKRKIGLLLTIVSVITMLMGCSQAERVSYNLSQEADNFNVVRQLTVINCMEGDVLFQMTGKISISVDETENQLEIIAENEDGTYSKDFVGLNQMITYTVKDLNLGANEVENYKYTINFNPKMWSPIQVDTID